MATICPYCNMEVRESAIEAEDGCCPECGAQITAASSLMDSPEAEYDGYGDEEETEEIVVLFADSIPDFRCGAHLRTAGAIGADRWCRLSGLVVLFVQNIQYK